MKYPVWQIVLLCLVGVSSIAQPYLQHGVAKAAVQVAHTIAPKPAQPHSLVYPDPELTPGAVRTTDAKEICAKTFRTGPYRHTSAATKAEVYREYGVIKGKGSCAHGCEVDHLIPLELGALDDIKDLWPEPYEPRPGAHEKDTLENKLHALVCGGQITLEDAQKEISTDWIASYEKHIGPVPVK
jgi:hypothetical protein